MYSVKLETWDFWCDIWNSKTQSCVCNACAVLTIRCVESFSHISCCVLRNNPWVSSKMRQVTRFLNNKLTSRDCWKVPNWDALIFKWTPTNATNAWLSLPRESTELDLSWKDLHDTHQASLVIYCLRLCAVFLGLKGKLVKLQSASEAMLGKAIVLSGSTRRLVN